MALPTLKRGSRGPAVADLQGRLIELGLVTDGIDSNFGEDTEVAVKQLQADNGLNPDGVVGPNTWALLEALGSVSFVFRSVLFEGDALLQAIADDLPENGGRTRISRGQHRNDPAVAKVQQALLDWDPISLPRFGPDGDYGNEAATAVRRFKIEELGVAAAQVIDDVGPLTVQRLDAIRAVAEGSPTPTPTPTPTGVRVRQDIWDLGDTANPWRDPAILAYALAVKAMQDLDTTNPNNGTSWINQAAIHKRNFGVAQDAGKLQDQCQHNCWYFLPWHRMYIFSFEEIVRSHMAADVARTWALPYWNYSDDPRRRALPPAFRERNLPASAGGGPNPLFVSRRQVSPIDINAGGDLGSETVELVNAMAPALFSRALPTPTQGFGGGDVGRTNHDRAGARGPLEGTPHGNVHVVVGGEAPDGLMTQFETAALDPIFWLHHSNIDRLWEAWRRGSNGGHGPGANPTQSTWLTQRFDFFDTTGSRVSRKAEDALDIERQLSYTYSNLPATFAPASDRDVELRPASVGDEQPPEMVGATEEPLTLNGLTQSTRMQVSAPLRPAGSDVGGGPQEPEHVYLSIDNVEGERNPGLVYSVFVNLPEGEPPEHPSPYFAGSMSFFGIEHSAAGAGDGGDEAPHSMQYGFDITPIVAQLKEEGRWDPGQLDVTITALAAPDEELAKREIPPVQIGRISLYVE